MAAPIRGLAAFDQAISATLSTQDNALDDNVRAGLAAGVIDDDGCPLRRKMRRDGSADSLGRPGDDSDFAFESLGHDVTPMRFSIRSIPGQFDGRCPTVFSREYRRGEDTLHDYLRFLRLPSR